MYFALAHEGKLDPEQPRIYFAPSREESRGWEDLFPLDRTAEVWMCRNLRRTFEGLDVPATQEVNTCYRGLMPDVWIQDKHYAIIIENKDGGGRHPRESDYLSFLREPILTNRKRAFLYSVPQEWLPNRREAEWWNFVRERDEGDEVIRGIIAWDAEFAELLCKKLCAPRWFKDKLPNRVDEGKFLHPGMRFWEAPEARPQTSA